MLRRAARMLAIDGGVHPAKFTLRDASVAGFCESA
jgi:hypothetical protein